MQILYFRQDDWEVLSRPLFKQLKSSAYTLLSAVGRQQAPSVLVLADTRSSRRQRQSRRTGDHGNSVTRTSACCRRRAASARSSTSAASRGPKRASRRQKKERTLNPTTRSSNRPSTSSAICRCARLDVSFPRSDADRRRSPAVLPTGAVRRIHHGRQRYIPQAQGVQDPKSRRGTCLVRRERPFAATSGHSLTICLSRPGLSTSSPRSTFARASTPSTKGNCSRSCAKSSSMSVRAHRLK